MTFAEWVQWQEQLERAQQSIEKEKKKRKDGEVSTKWMKSLMEKLIPDKMKGEIPNELWMMTRDPSTFCRMANDMSSRERSELKRHFLDEAKSAMDQLNGLLWKPIVRKCADVGEALESSSRCEKPVSMCVCVCACPELNSVFSGGFQIGKKRGKGKTRVTIQLFICSVSLGTIAMMTIQERSVLYMVSLVMDADLLFARSIFVSDPFCCVQSWRPFSD